MMHEQKKAALKHFDSAKVKGSSFSFPSSCGSVASSGPSSQPSQDSSTALEGEGSSLLHPKQVSMSARSCGISTLPFATLDAMWSKAEEYLNSSNVVQAPGDDPKSKMVTSGNTPHFVRVLSHSQYVCDKNCMQWSSSRICSHTLVAAEVNGELKLFLQWYVSSGQEPNITQLAHAGLPA